MEAIERENAQNLPGSAFQCHNIDIQRPVEEIKVGQEVFYSAVLKFDKSTTRCQKRRATFSSFLFSFLGIYNQCFSRTEGQTPHRLTLKGERQFRLRQEFYVGRR